MRRHGFTIVELMVVLALVAILLALLMPSLRAARSAAQTAGCLSNLHQIAAAATVYATDNTQTYPSRKYQTNVTLPNTSAFCTLGKNGAPTYFNTGDLNISQRELNAYVGGPYKDGDEVKIAQCPADHASGNSAYRSTYDFRGASYALNSYPANNGWGWPTLAPDGKTALTLDDSHTLAQVRSPARFVLYTDYAAQMIVFVNPTTPADPAFYWHQAYPTSKFSLAFVDGHSALTTLLASEPCTDAYSFTIDK